VAEGVIEGADGAADRDGSREAAADGEMEAAGRVGDMVALAADRGGTLEAAIDGETETADGICDAVGIAGGGEARMMGDWAGLGSGSVATASSAFSTSPGDEGKPRLEASVETPGDGNACTDGVLALASALLAICSRLSKGRYADMMETPRVPTTARTTQRHAK